MAICAGGWRLGLVVGGWDWLLVVGAGCWLGGDGGSNDCGDI